jgi:hypothetical protein
VPFPDRDTETARREDLGEAGSCFPVSHPPAVGEGATRIDAKLEHAVAMVNGVTSGFNDQNAVSGKGLLRRSQNPPDRSKMNFPVISP